MAKGSSMLTAAIRARFSGNKSFAAIPGFPSGPANTANSSQIFGSWAYGNSSEDRWANAAGTDEIRALSVNSADQVMIGEGLASKNRKTAQWSVQDNGSISSAGFFLVNTGESYRVTAITWEHATQSSVAGTAYVEKTPSGTAIGSGTSLMSGTFDLHAIANATVTTATLTTTNSGDSDNPDLILNVGDQLSVVIAGTITSLVGVVCTVHLAPLGRSSKVVSYYLKANADLVQAQYFFTANRAYGPIQAISVRYSTKTSVAALKLTVTKDTGTTAAGGGTSLLTNNTNAGLLVDAVANTTYSGTLSATAATIRLASGDRLAIKFSGGTLTALVGVVVTVSFQEFASDRTEKTFFLDHIPGAADLTGWIAESFWIAERDYEVLDISMVGNVATGAAAKVTVTADSGTTAAGAGTVLNTANSSAGFDLNATARTTQFATLPAANLRFLLTGDRLSYKPSGTLTTGAGVALTVSLRPC